MAPLYSLGQADQNKVQQDLFGHVMPLPLALVSSETDGGINALLSSYDQNEVQHDFFWSCDSTGISTT